MVTTASSYDFGAMVDAFFTSRPLTGPHAALILTTIRSRALALLEKPDMRYMPTFKVLDLLATLSDIARAMDDAPQLRPSEVQALLRESLADTAPLARQFMLDAALERVRYEPLMLLDAHFEDGTSERERILERRWAAMRAEHQERAPLPDAWIERIDEAVDAVLNAEQFSRFRQGPLLQLFAEMLELARTHFNRREPLAALEYALSENGKLWRRYALKSARYEEKPLAPLSLYHMPPASHHLH